MMIRSVETSPSLSARLKSSRLVPFVAPAVLRLALQPLPLLRDLARLDRVGHHREGVAGRRHALEAEDLHRDATDRPPSPSCRARRRARARGRRTCRR